MRYVVLVLMLGVEGSGRAEKPVDACDYFKASPIGDVCHWDAKTACDERSRQWATPKTRKKADDAFARCLVEKPAKEKKREQDKRDTDKLRDPKAPPSNLPPWVH